jgi:hypothetical protein
MIFAKLTHLVCRCCRSQIRLGFSVMKQNDSPRPLCHRLRIVVNFAGLIALSLSPALVSCGDGGDDDDSRAGGGKDDVADQPSSPAPQVIKIERAARVGDRYHFNGQGQSRQEVEMSMGGKLMPERSQSEDFSAELVADVEVLAINENDKPSQVTVMVKSLTRADDGAAPVTLLENTVVDAVNEAGGVSYSIAGIAVEEKTQQAIKLFTLLNRNKSKADEDAIFGTAESHVPGDEWPVDKAAIANFFSEDTGMQLVPDSIQGSMKFEKVESIDGVACQLLAGQVRMDMASFPGVPADASLSGSSVDVSLSGAFPVDPSLPVAEKSMSMKMSPSLEYTSNGITVEMRMTMERTVTSRKTPKQ